MTSDAEKNPQDFDGLFAERERQDAADAIGASKDASPTTSSSVDATCMYQENESAKQERDVAFALAVLEANHLSERQLVNAIKDWTIHGEESLSAHLVNKKLITTALCDELEQKAEKNLHVAAGRASHGDGSTSGSAATLFELDSSGRIIRLMGLSITAEPALSDQERHVTSRFKLLRKIGQGGMGTVWLARDERMGRLVAIKEIRKYAQGNESALHRFRREAQVTGRLEHPSVVPVHQLSERHDSEKAFYVMRFIGKRTLEDAITEYHERRDAGDENPMHLHHLLTAFVTICQAIAYAHSRNVVHRDLKPENIALDDYGQVIVLDWGLAKLTGRGELQEVFGDIEQSDMSLSDESTAGQVLGTPMYMAPEQAAGRVDEIEQTTDVYGLGGILFSILTGYAPHELSHQSLTSSSKVSELFQAIVSSPAPQALSLNPDAPAELSAICTKAMANKRYARYDNALEIADDVQHWMAGEPVSTYAEPWRKRARRWMITHQRVSQLAGILLTVLIVTAIALGITSQQTRMAEERNRFEDLKSDGRELEVSLRGISAQLAKDARFMASLPPIQAIVGVRAGMATDSEDVWRGRLETIYRGLLESNPNYLTASYASITSGQDVDVEAVDSRVHEIVHVERLTSAEAVRVMPKSRLLSRETSGFLAAILKLKPGDVSVDASTVHSAAETSSADGVVLASGTPVYSDINGDVFGVVTVETDLAATIRELLVTTIEAGENAYIVDNEGKVILHYSRDLGFQEASVGDQIGELVEAPQDFFAYGAKANSFSDGRETHGIKVRIDPRHSTEYLGILLTVVH